MHRMAETPPRSMSAKDNPPSGLLSKVAKFVRNPTTNWSDIDKLEAEPEEPGYSKQALKEMIERKRQNDWVRKQEFDRLRKLRSRGGVNTELARPSYFQSSLPANSDERAMTIKKIDEIEAQMSNQWWQGKQGSAPPASKSPPGDPVAAPAPSSANDSGQSSANIMSPSEAATTAQRSQGVEPAPAPSAPPPSVPASRTAAEELAYAPTKLAPMQPETPPVADASTDFPPTRPNSGFGRQGAMTTVPSQFGGELPPSQMTPARAPPGPGNFGQTQGFMAESATGISDPDLEEAAIRFANGDNQGAENGLLTALRENSSARPGVLEARIGALFDLYRATGQQQRFDTMAIEFAERYGRSAPAWFSMPERVGTRSASPDSELSAADESDMLRDIALWSSPATLDQAAARALQRAVSGASEPWHIDWRAVRRVSDEAVGVLGTLFSRWADSPVQLRFVGVDALHNALRAIAPSGDKSVPTTHWQLRMDALRVLRLQDEFELVALDYCVTYEVSPPSWQDVRCTVTVEASAPGAGRPASGAAVSVAEGLETGERDDTGGLSTRSDIESSAPKRVELSGEILGEATDALAKLETARAGAGRMVISCANLIRVDFSAAGSILNWAATRQAEGCSLQFRDVHQLVAAFFNVIGIHEHARVVVRAT